MLQKLQEEVDTAVPGDETVLTYDQVKHLPYLGNAINKTIHVQIASSTLVILHGSTHTLSIPFDHRRNVSFQGRQN